MLCHDMARQGQWLFTWRSYFPAIIVPSAIAAFPQSCWMQRLFGTSFEEAFDLVCLAVALAGLAIRIFTVGHVPTGTSGRNTRRQKADVLNTSGSYSLLRHPLYFANFLCFLGLILTLKSGLFILFASCAYFLYYERIMLAEEHYLEQRFGDRYRRWASQTPAFVPRLSGWVPPALPFCWRAALSREYHTVFLIAALFLASELAESIFVEGETVGRAVQNEWVWIILFAIFAALYITVRALKKLRWLTVERQ